MSLLLILSIVTVAFAVSWLEIDGILGEVVSFVISFFLLFFILRPLRIKFGIADFGLSFLKKPILQSLLIYAWIVLVGGLVMEVSWQIGTRTGNDIIQDSALGVAFIWTLFGASLLTSLLELISTKSQGD
jgi:hypothetical protein